MANNTARIRRLFSRAASKDQDEIYSSAKSQEDDNLRVKGWITIFEERLIQFRHALLSGLALIVLIFEYRELKDFEHPQLSLIFEILFPILLLVFLYILMEVLIRIAKDERAAVQLVNIKHSLSLKLSGIDDWDRMKEAALGEFCTISKPKCGYLFIRNYGEETLDLVLEWNPEAGFQTPKSSQFLPTDLLCDRCDHDWLHPSEICGLRETEFIKTYGNGYLLPLMYGDEIIGEIFFQLAQGQTITSELSKILNSIAGDISASLNNAFQRKMLLEIKMAEAASAERTAVSRDLHDTLSQNLGYIQLMLDQSLFLEDGDKVQMERSDLTKMHAAASESFEMVRSTLRELRTVKSTVSVLLQTQARSVAERNKLGLKFIEEGQSRVLPQEIMLQLNLIIGEALNNIIKHSKAENIEAQINWDDCYLSIRVRDDGQGFDLAKVAQSQHFGLAIMRERVETLKGYFNLKTAPDEGTEVFIQIPFRDESF